MSILVKDANKNGRYVKTTAGSGVHTPHHIASTVPTALGGAKTTESTPPTGGEGTIGWASAVHKVLADIVAWFASPVIDYVEGTKGYQLHTTSSVSWTSGSTITIVSIDFDDPAYIDFTFLVAKIRNVDGKSITHWIEYSADGSNWYEFGARTGPSTNVLLSRSAKKVLRYLRLRAINADATATITTHLVFQR